MLATSTTTTIHPSPRSSFSLFNTHIEFRSMFIATLFLFLFLCLAYLSNPSETSFRSYLTEQSVRHHLSRLDDPADPDHTDSEDSKTNYHRSSSSQSHPSFGSLESGSSAFHFSNRAAIALRTPRHAFHSFGFFTIAAVIPNLKTHPPSRETSPVISSARNTTTASYHDFFPSKELWFVGAFGRWWRGGVVDPSWSPRPTPHSKGDEEGWSSGILNIKALDRLEDFNGLPFPTTTHNPRTPQRSAPPKLRSRDRSTSRRHQSSTPPPPPKSALLPLHTPKHSQSLTTSQSPASHQRPLPQHLHPSPPSANGATITGSSPNFDSIPAVAELTQQISQTRALNLELRNQLSEHTNTASAVDTALSVELSNVREAKRIEDTARSELKARTKTLEDNRRAAEAGKRDAERRLRATQKAKAEAGTRLEKLGEEIRALESQVQQDEVAIRMAGEVAVREELDIRAQVQHRKQEVRVAEEVVMAFNARVRELEEAIECERITLVAAREKAEALQHEQEDHKYGFIPRPQLDTWEPIPTEFTLTTLAPVSRVGHEILDPFPTPLEKDSDSRERSGSGSASTRSSPHLGALTTAPSLNIGYSSPSQPQLHAIGAPESFIRLTKGYSIFDEDLASLSNPTQGSKFSPFGDSDVANGGYAPPAMPNGPIQSLDGVSTSTAAGEFEVLEEMPPRTFQSGNEMLFDRDWQCRLPAPESDPAIASASDSRGHAFPLVDDDSTEVFEPFGNRPPPRSRITSDPINVARVWPSRTNSDLVSPPVPAVPPQGARTRWWQCLDKERRSTIDGTETRRGLNPGAKAFNFSARPFLGGPVKLAFDSLNASTSGFPIPGATSSSGTSNISNGANGHATTTTTATGSNTPGFFSGLAMRAFAPSPAEREALQRALGGPKNTSLERLPSLSEVGNLPTSPVLSHTQPHSAASDNSLSLPWLDVGPGSGAGRSWLREPGISMPRPGKIKFSPWGDGDGIEADK